MASVTQVAKMVKQPRGGYLNPKKLSVLELETTNNLLEDENIAAGLIGTAVDYLTRFVRGDSLRNAFKVSLIGAKLIGKLKEAEKLLSTIVGLDNASIISACKIVGYDVCCRAGMNMYKPVEEINPNESTIINVRTMVQRSQKFFELYGPVIKDGFKFSEKGYTNKVSVGDGDFLTKDTLWDMKVTVKAPTNIHTLQLVMYYIMGKHSGQEIFNSITKIGIFNPRLNKVYTYDMELFPKEIIEEIEKEVICY